MPEWRVRTGSPPTFAMRLLRLSRNLALLHAVGEMSTVGSADLTDRLRYCSGVCSRHMPSLEVLRPMAGPERNGIVFKVRPPCAAGMRKSRLLCEILPLAWQDHRLREAVVLEAGALGGAALGLEEKGRLECRRRVKRWAVHARGAGKWARARVLSVREPRVGHAVGRHAFTFAQVQRYRTARVAAPQGTLRTSQRLYA